MAIFCYFLRASKTTIGRIKEHLYANSTPHTMDFFTLFYRLHGITRNVHRLFQQHAFLIANIFVTQRMQKKYLWTETKRKQLFQASFVFY